MAPPKKGIVMIDGDRTAGTRERGIGGSWFFGIFRADPLGHDDESDSRLETTIAAVDWNAVASVACRLLGVTDWHWGSQLSGGYNVVRFLHMDDINRTILVVRVPYRPEEGWTAENSKIFAGRLSSEVATMEYVRVHTSIPVPRIIHHSIEVDSGGVGSPYIIMTKVDGVALCSIWDDMEDSKREIVLRQVVDILLELASQRFDKIGMLFQQDSPTDPKSAWYIMPYIGSTTPGPGDTTVQASLYKTFTSVIDYWLAYANIKLKTIHDTRFGHFNKIYEYGMTWCLRSLIPALYDPSLDTAGFPLCPGDFHSQNIMIVDADTSPRISAVIDWEFSCTHGTSSFSQYPLFIVDHPQWEDDHPLRQRNIRDQATFISLMREAERKKDPTGDLPLSRAFASCQGVYLFEQSIQFPIMASELYPQLFAHIYGEDKAFSTEYYWALIEQGILKKEAQQFKEETEVWNEVLNTLGSELVSSNMSRTEFRIVVQNHLDRFPKGGLVKDWLSATH